MTSHGSKQVSNRIVLLESTYSYDSGKNLLDKLKLRADAVTPSASSEGLDAYFVARFVFFFSTLSCSEYSAPTPAKTGMFRTTPDVHLNQD